VRRAGCWSALALAAVILSAGQARADRLDEAWRRGNDAYLKGDYAAAVTAYEEVDRQGLLSADLSFNLGNAYFRKGALGPAIWAFERAVVLDPGDEDARFNLEQARKLAASRGQDRITGEQHEPAWIRAVTSIGPSQLTWLFLVLYVGCFVAAIARRRAREDLRSTLGAITAVLATGALLTGALLYGRVQLERTPFGVVLPDAVAVKEGADPNYRTSFDVHAGLRVRIVERDQDWSRIRLGNGLEGWVRSSDVGKL
jgi:tetratricopeptide (TPR) repeat protein